jgi:hypothetical protein
VLPEIRYLIFYVTNPLQSRVTLFYVMYPLLVTEKLASYVTEYLSNGNFAHHCKQHMLREPLDWIFFVPQGMRSLRTFDEELSANSEPISKNI